MLLTDSLIITPEILRYIAEIDEFKGTWRTLGTLAPERLSALRRVATIESISSSTLNMLVSRVQEARLLPAREDRFLTCKEAAELLACEPSAVGRRVRPVSHETWSYLMIQDFMADQREKALEKARMTAEKRAKKTQGIT